MRRNGFRFGEPRLRIFLTKSFMRFVRRHSIEDTDLRDAICRVTKGLIDADLGGGVIKQRIARPNQGKSGGYRSIILFRRGNNAFFVYGFSKSSRHNLRSDEVTGFRRLADVMLSYDEAALDQALDSGVIREVNPGGKDISE